jgi:hypothetical protein
MIKFALKFVLATGAIFVMCIVLVVGQAQAILLDPINGSYPEGWGIVIEFDDGVLKQIEGITEEGLAEFFTYDIDVQDPYTIDVEWDLSDFDGLNLFAITAKAGGDMWYHPVSIDQLVVGAGQIVSTNGHGISDIRLSVPDASIVWLLGTSLIILGLLGRRKSKN